MKILITILFFSLGIFSQEPGKSFEDGRFRFGREFELIKEISPSMTTNDKSYVVDEIISYFKEIGKGIELYEHFSVIKYDYSLDFILEMKDGSHPVTARISILTTLDNPMIQLTNFSQQKMNSKNKKIAELTQESFSEFVGYALRSPFPFVSGGEIDLQNPAHQVVHLMKTKSLKEESEVYNKVNNLILSIYKNWLKIHQNEKFRELYNLIDWKKVIWVRNDSIDIEDYEHSIRTRYKGRDLNLVIKIEGDGSLDTEGISIRKEGNSLSTLEIPFGPVYRDDEGEYLIYRHFINYVSDPEFGYSVNDSTGGHFHIQLTNRPWSEITNLNRTNSFFLLTLYFFLEHYKESQDVLYEKFAKRKGVKDYAKKLESIKIKNMQEAVVRIFYMAYSESPDLSEIDSIGEVLEEIINFDPKKEITEDFQLVEVANLSKYYGLNLLPLNRLGTIEARFADGVIDIETSVFLENLFYSWYQNAFLKRSILEEKLSQRKKMNFKTLLRLISDSTKNCTKFLD